MLLNLLNSILVLFVFVACVGNQPKLTERGKLVRVAMQTQETTFFLNDHCRQDAKTTYFNNINELKNTAATVGANAVQILFQNPYNDKGHARIWHCPKEKLADFPTDIERGGKL